MLNKPNQKVLQGCIPVQKHTKSSTMKKINLLILLLSIFAFSCTQKKAKTTSSQPVAKVDLVYHVEGMTCDDCEMSIRKGVNELEGIESIEANHEDSTAHVIFDPSKTDSKQIIAAIERRGYHVVE